jgi:hypothetical protein
LVRLMAVDNYKKRAYGAYYPRMVHMGSIWEIQVYYPLKRIKDAVAGTH